MITADAVRDINALQPEEQVLVMSMVNSFKKQGRKKTSAQIQFEEECSRYQGCNMSMDEIDAIIHEGNQA